MKAIIIISFVIIAVGGLIVVCRSAGGFFSKDK